MNIFYVSETVISAIKNYAKGIYYREHSYVYEVSNDEGNMYWVADSFNNFLELLNK